MNEDLSIGTDTVGETDVLSVSATDADENVVVDVKHLTVDPENVTRFREQLHSESQSKETESTSTAEGATKRDASESPILKHSAPNERNFFGNNGRNTPPFVAGKAHTCPSQSQNTDGSRKDFREKSMKFDISSQSAALKAYGRISINNVTHEEHVLYKSPFFEAPDPSKISVKNTKDFRETFANTETLPTDMPLWNTSSRNKTNFPAGVSQADPDLPQPSQTLKSPATLLRELQTPTASTGTCPSGASDVASASIHAQNSEAVTKELSSGIPSAETFHASENRTTPHPYGGNDTVSANASATKSTETAQQNVPETSKSLSKTDNTASTAEPLSKIKTRERPRSSESASDMHKTAVWETIPFLRTTVETTAPVSDPTAAQASKSHATLIAQQIRDHIIDRILVSSSALNDNRTVTVQLSPRLLQDTEVQFTQNGTSLDIRLVSQNKDSVQFLQQHQSDLQTYLQGELKTYRAISVRVPSSQTTSELAQPHDGRSRNRFEYQPADEEETT